MLRYVTFGKVQNSKSFVYEMISDKNFSLSMHVLISELESLRVCQMIKYIVKEGTHISKVLVMFRSHTPLSDLLNLMGCKPISASI